jgi:hypothetical protein
MLRIFFNYNRRLLGDLYRCALRSLTRYFEVLAGSELIPGVITAIQTFGNRINVHPRLHFLVTEGGVDKAGLFYEMPPIDDWRLAELFGWEVLADLLREELLSPEWFALSDLHPLSDRVILFSRAPVAQWIERRTPDPIRVILLTS